MGGQIGILLSPEECVCLCSPIYDSVDLYISMSFDIDERLIAEEMKDFINEDVEEEGEEESGDEGDGQAGKRKHDSDDQLDDQLSDDDYDLIEENLGIKVKRKVQYHSDVGFSEFYLNI